MEEGKHLALLGELAWRAGLGETFVTDALAVILRHNRVREAVLGLLAGRLAMDFGTVTQIRAEVDHREFGRTDIEGQDAAGRPVVIFEAKFAASLTEGQVRRYLQLQDREFGNEQAALVLLVPTQRIEETKLLAERARQRADGSRHRSKVLCLHWEEILSTADTAADLLDQGPRSLKADLVQLRDLVEARTRIVLPPLGASLGGPEWEQRRAQLVELVDLASRRLAELTGVTRGPLVGRRDLVYSPAYYLRARGPVPGTYYAIGLNAGFAGEGLTPMWLRFHKLTGQKLGVRVARPILAEAGYTLRNDQGHLWVPIQLHTALENEALVENVVNQVLAVLAAVEDPDQGPLEHDGVAAAEVLGEQ